MLEIHENYREYQAPSWVRSTVERLLASLAPEHTVGLRSIVLTNSLAVRGKTRRIAGRKYKRNECGGFYQRATRNEQAWIELIVDNFATGYPRPFVAALRVLLRIVRAR